MISTYFGAEDGSLALFGFVLKRQKEMKQPAANRTHYNLAEIFFYFTFLNWFNFHFRATNYL